MMPYQQFYCLYLIFMMTEFTNYILICCQPVDGLYGLVQLLYIVFFIFVIVSL